MSDDPALVQTFPTARAGFEDFLGRFREVRVAFIDHPDLVVPVNIRPVGKVEILAYGLDMVKPIPDLEITDEGIHATLSFSCEPYKTFVPWAAVQGFRGYGERTKQRAQLRSV
jgi:hypothetical protein